MLPFFLTLLIGCASSRRIPKEATTHSSNISTTAPVNTADVLKVVDALGGVEALQQIKGFSHHGGKIYRSATLGQTYNMNSLDQHVASTGSQSMSFQIQGSGLLSRINRAYAYDLYWGWALPDLHPEVNMSVVVHDASDQYACFLSGSNSFLYDLTDAQGYTDGLLTAYLIHMTRQFALPWLLQTFLSNTTALQQYKVLEPYTLAKYNAIDHSSMGLTLLYDDRTGLPHAVRSHEDHIIYGPSTSDLIFTEFRAVTVIKGQSFTLPHRLQTVYNTRDVLEDVSLDSITINPQFSDDYFEGRAPNADKEDSIQGMTPVEPEISDDYPLWEVHEYFESGLWGGNFNDMFNSSNVILEYPDPKFRNIARIYVGYPDYVQLLVEHERGFIITDAAAHRSQIILQWLRENRPDKKVTHVVPSHHHRDHAGGVDDYVNDGATLVVPFVACDYYFQARNRHHTHHNIITYDENKPFVFKDSLIEFRSYWNHDNPHPEDWSFAVASKADPTETDQVVLFEADVINPGTNALNFESDVARAFLINVAATRVPRSTLLVGAHGTKGTTKNAYGPLWQIADVVGLSYPKWTVKDWMLKS